MRCEIARAILDAYVSNQKMFCFDEFTSVVDRTVARVSSFAIQKALRKTNTQFVAVTCHYDVQEWLMPDWVFRTDDMTFQLLKVEEQKKNRRKLQLRIYETKRKEYYWRMFAKYHYLSHSFNKTARVFIATCDEMICGFCAVLPFPHPIKRNCWKEHRTVVFPDFQGIGIGTAFTNAVAQMYADEGKTFISTTSNPAMIFARSHSDKWRTTRIGRASLGSETGKIQNKHKKGSTSTNRITVSFEYKK